MAFPQGLDSPNIGESLRGTLGPCLAKGGALGDIRPITGQGFVGLDGVANSDDELQRAFMGCVEEKYGSASFDPDIWQPVVIRNPDDAQARLDTVAGRQVQFPRARRLHRFDPARADRSAAGLENSDLRRSAAVDQSGIFAVQARRLRHHSQQNRAGTGGTKYCRARRFDRNQRPQSHRAPIRRVQKRKGHRRHDHRQVGDRHAALSSRSRHDHARLPGPGALSQHLHDARRWRRMADASRDYDRRSDAIGRTDPPVR